MVNCIFCDEDSDAGSDLNGERPTVPICRSCFHANRKTTTTTYTPADLAVQVGRVEISKPAPEPGHGRIGYGTTIKVDGKELTGVRRIALDIQADELIKVTVEQLA